MEVRQGFRDTASVAKGVVLISESSNYRRFDRQESQDLDTAGFGVHTFCSIIPKMKANIPMEVPPAPHSLQSKVVPPSFSRLGMQGLLN